MGLNKDGTVFSTLSGNTPEESALKEIEEMREELRQIGSRLSMIEGQVRTKTDPKLMSQNFSTLFWWHLRLMESFYALIWALYGSAKQLETIKDFQRRFADGMVMK